MSHDLEARLDHLESIEATRRLAVDYAFGFDGQDPEIIGRIFHDDAVLDLGPGFGRHVGLEAIQEAARGFWAASPHMHHHMTNIAVDIDGDRGTGVVNLHCMVANNDDGEVMVSGTYVDRYERRDGRWAIADRAFEMHFWSPLRDWEPTMGTEAERAAETA